MQFVTGTQATTLCPEGTSLVTDATVCEDKVAVEHGIQYKLCDNASILEAKIGDDRNPLKNDVK